MSLGRDPGEHAGDRGGRPAKPFDLRFVAVLRAELVGRTGSDWF